MIVFAELFGPCYDWYSSEVCIFWDMPKGPKNGFKKSKNEERHQMHENLKNQALETVLRVKYVVGINFIDF